MTKRFYIASSFKNIQSVNYITGQLQNHNLVQTYNWTINKRAVSVDDLVQIGNKEYNGVLNSYFLIIVFPAGKITYRIWNCCSLQETHICI